LPEYLGFLGLDAAATRTGLMGGFGSTFVSLLLAARLLLAAVLVVVSFSSWSALIFLFSCHYLALRR
jgi:hypothetical protein